MRFPWFLFPMLSADVFKCSEIISNKHVSAFRWPQGVLTVSRQNAPPQPAPNHLRGPFQVQQGKGRENLKVNPILNQTIMYLGQTSNVMLYFSQHYWRTVHFSSTLKRGGKKETAENHCTLRLKKGNGSEGFPTSNLDLFCREAASLFRA